MEQKSNRSASILYILAWLVCSILVIVDVLSIREASKDILTAARANQIAKSAEGEKGSTLISTGFKMTAIDQGFLFIGGILAVVLAIAIEYYFRIGNQKGILLKRIGLVVAIQVGVFIICVLIQTFV